MNFKMIGERSLRCVSCVRLWSLGVAVKPLTAAAAILLAAIVLVASGTSPARAYQRCDDCQNEARCSVRLMMLDVRNAISTVLDGRTLSEMRQMALSDNLPLMYHI